MKRPLSSILAAVVLITTGCSNKDITVTDVEITPTVITLYVGNKETLVANVEPADATNKSVSWVSDKPGIATVNDNGEVTAIAEGTATIIAATQDGGKIATCVVTVANSLS